MLKKIIKLSIVIAAIYILDNLISLRRFADLDLSNYLDKQKLRIYDDKSGTKYLTGKHEQHNWIVFLDITIDNHTHKDKTQNLINIRAPRLYTENMLNYKRRRAESENHLMACVK